MIHFRPQVIRDSASVSMVTGLQLLMLTVSRGLQHITYMIHFDFSIIRPVICVFPSLLLQA